MLNSRRLLSGPSRAASSESSLARPGKRGGKTRCCFSKGFVLREFPDVRSVVSSGEYMGGRDLSFPGIIGAGGGASGSDSKGFGSHKARRNGHQNDNFIPPSTPIAVFRPSHRLCQASDRKRCGPLHWLPGASASPASCVVQQINCQQGDDSYL
jgi:hypothetical protein